MLFFYWFPVAISRLLSGVIVKFLGWFIALYRFCHEKAHFILTGCFCNGVWKVISFKKRNIATVFFATFFLFFLACTDQDDSFLFIFSDFHFFSMLTSRRYFDGTDSHNQTWFSESQKVNPSPIIAFALICKTTGFP